VSSAAPEVLRGGFKELPQTLCIQIVPEVTVPIIQHDVSTLPPEVAEEKALALLRQEKDKPFSMDTPPLMRAVVVQMPSEHDEDSGMMAPVWKLLLVLHHAAVDGFSMGVVARELDQL
jgi:hypothetical protein